MDNVAFTFRFEKTSNTGRFIAGWASVIEEDGEPVTDTQGDVIEMEELRKAAHEFVKSTRVAKAMHRGAQIGEIVESVLIDDDFCKALGAGTTKRGWWIGMEIHDPEIRKRVRNGELKAFSVGGSGKRTPID